MSNDMPDVIYAGFRLDDCEEKLIRKTYWTAVKNGTEGETLYLSASHVAENYVPREWVDELLEVLMDYNATTRIVPAESEGKMRIEPTHITYTMQQAEKLDELFRRFGEVK